MEYKFVELLSTAFVASDEDTVRQNISSPNPNPNPDPNSDPNPNPNPNPEPEP